MNDYSKLTKNKYKGFLTIFSFILANILIAPTTSVAQEGNQRCNSPGLTQIMRDNCTTRVCRSYGSYNIWEYTRYQCTPEVQKRFGCQKLEEELNLKRDARNRQISCCDETQAFGYNTQTCKVLIPGCLAKYDREKAELERYYNSRNCNAGFIGNHEVSSEVFAN